MCINYLDFIYKKKPTPLNCLIKVSGQSGLLDWIVPDGPNFTQNSQIFYTLCPFLPAIMLSLVWKGKPAVIVGDDRVWLGIMHLSQFAGQILCVLFLHGL